MEKRFVHRGSAVALSGHLSRVDQSEKGWPIPAQACSHLSVSGGEAKASIKSYTLAITEPRTATLLLAKGLETWAESTADLDKKTASSQTRAAIGSLVIDGGFSTGALCAHLKSSHGPRDRVPMITPHCDQTQFDIKLGDSVLGVTLDPTPFQECATKAKLKALYKRSKAFRQEHFRRFNTAESADEMAEGRNGANVVSLVKSIVWKTNAHPNVKIDGYTIIWKGFGRIIVGEMLVSDFYRRLTMVRMAYGSPIKGVCAFAEVETNGNFMP